MYNKIIFNKKKTNELMIFSSIRKNKKNIKFKINNILKYYIKHSI